MTDFSDIKTRTQRQDSLIDQIRDLHQVANILGMYDAADWLGWFLRAAPPHPFSTTRID